MTATTLAPPRARAAQLPPATRLLVLEQALKGMSREENARRAELAVDDVAQILRHAGAPDRRRLTMNARVLQGLVAEGAPAPAQDDAAPGQGRPTPSPATRASAPPPSGSTKETPMPTPSTPEPDSQPVIPITPPGAGQRRLADLPVVDVYPDPSNPRDDLGDMDDMIASVRGGIVQPIVVRQVPDVYGYVVVDGHRRLAAAKALGWVTIPGVVDRSIPHDEVLERMVTANGQRVALDPVKEAQALRAILRRRKLGSPAQLSHLIGRSESYIRSRLALLDLSPDEQQRVSRREVGIGEAAGAARAGAARTGAKPARRTAPPPAARPHIAAFKRALSKGDAGAAIDAARALVAALEGDTDAR